MNALGGNNTQAVAFKAVNDFTGQIVLGGIRFDDGKSAFNGHERLLNFG
jgi:hypothetical protein